MGSIKVQNMTMKFKLPGAIGLAALCFQTIASAQNTSLPAPAAQTDAQPVSTPGGGTVPASGGVPKTTRNCP